MFCQVRAGCSAHAAPASVPATLPHLRAHERRRGGVSQAGANAAMATAAAPAAVLEPRTAAQTMAEGAVATSAGSSVEGSNMPDTLSAALAMFFKHPSVIAAVSIIAGSAAVRMHTSPLSMLDVPVCLLAVGIWLVQEWVIHKYLLHSSFNWLGKVIHESHHAQPYHHVSIDGPEIVVPFMALTGGLFYLLLHGGGMELVATTCFGYWLAGLLSYTLVHFLVHTRWIPSSGYMRTVRQNHMLHHLRNHDNWFAFSIPQMDVMMGTCPATPSSVPLKTAVRRAAKGDH